LSAFSGKFQDTEGQQGCRITSAGNYSGVAAGGPTRCKRGSVAPLNGMDHCVQCDDIADSSPEGDFCVCPKGMFSESLDIDKATVQVCAASLFANVP
jgi:hypothetical protein